METSREIIHREHVYHCGIEIERRYQNLKWGTIKEHPHTVGEWLLIMQGELNEAIEAWRKGANDERALQEILQAVAVGVACIEQHGIQHEPSHTAWLFED